MTTDDGAPSPPKPPRRRSRAAGPGAGEDLSSADTSGEGISGLQGSAEAGENAAAETPIGSPTPNVVEDGAPIQADRVEVRMAAVGRVDAGEVQVLQGAIGGVRGTDVSVQQGALGGALAGRVSIRQSVARSVLAREVVVQQSFVRTIVAAQVRVEQATGVGILIARQVTGDVRVLVDWRAAAAFGAAFGAVAGLLRLGGRRRQGR